MAEKVMIAMSGGVDSSVAALLLKKAGYEVIGVTMCFGKSGRGDRASCCGEHAIQDARLVCNYLGIPHHVMDFSSDLERYVIKNFLAEYSLGRTPNPCLDCNRHLKFDLLLKKAIALGFDFLATGHYAAIERENGKYYLKKPKDKKKDQTYFLCHISYEALKRIIFPLASFVKEETRKMASEEGLPVAEKEESQDICFVPERDYRSFLTERLTDIEPGPIMDKKGVTIGYHRGLPFYTVGQRTKLGISGREPRYVIFLDAKRNVIIVGNKKDLEARAFIAEDVNLLVEKLPFKALAKIRYRKSEEECQIIPLGDKLQVIFVKEQEAITPGQAVVFYEGDKVLGGGIIKGVLDGTCRKN